MMHAVYVAAAVGEKARLWTKQCQAVKKSNPLLFPLLSYVWLKASVSQLVENSVNRKFHNNLMFRVDLKTFLGLAMPNQYCLTVDKEM